MLDPTIKSYDYMNYLIRNKKEEYKIKNFEQYPDVINIPRNVIVRVHLNIIPVLEHKTEENNKTLNKISLIDKMTKQNMKSRLFLHVDVSHMIHYKIPHVIIDSIKEIYKLN